jgi:hypothetical protein
MTTIESSQQHIERVRVSTPMVWPQLDGVPVVFQKVSVPARNAARGGWHSS